MIRVLIGWILAVVAVLGSGLTGLAWLVVATVVCGERASRNPRRHFRLRRLQREPQTAYDATPGRIPAGPTVRLGDPTPHYDPGRLTDPAEGDSWSAQ